MAAQKDANRRHQMAANQPIIESISEKTGKVRVWVFVEKRWKELWPVDAAEQVRTGIAALSIIAMRGPAGEIMVDTDRIEEYRARGYRLPDEPDPEPAPARTEQTKNEQAPAHTEQIPAQAPQEEAKPAASSRKGR